MQTVPTTGFASLRLGAPESGATPRRAHARRRPGSDTLARLLTVLVVVGVTGFVFAEVRPDLLFGPNLDVGGDNAAHVTAVYYFVHHLLPGGHLSGWDPQWNGGFPLYVFYFPLPAVFVGLLTVPFSYAVAFKLVTVLGALTLPVAAYTFGRLSGLRRPIPALMCVAMVPFLFNTSYTIDGGNIASTMAGEFSFSLAVSFALFFLGVFTYAVRTGRFGWLAAVLFAATALCHVVPALFAAVVALLIAGAFWTRRSLLVLVTVAVTGGLLAAVWLLPFADYLRAGFSSSMNYARVGSALDVLFPRGVMLILIVLAFFGTVFALLRHQRVIQVLAVASMLSALAFQFLPSGLVYNARWLPFWFLAISLVAAFGVAELFRLGLALAYRPFLHDTLTPLFASALTVLLVASWTGALPVLNFPAAQRSFAPGWVAWNYTGFQAKPGWTEFSNLVAMLDRATKRNGCGLLDYEYSPNMTNSYGSTLAPMSFPLWTNNCVETTEGVYYESSTTTPFHFLDQAELSLNASNPVRGIPYAGFNVADGIADLQLMGVKYFLANSPQVEAAARHIKALTAIGEAPAGPLVVDSIAGSATPSAGHWVLYRIHGDPLVAPLAYQPVVEPGLSNTAFHSLAIRWYQNRRYWPAPIARSGLPGWRVVRGATLVAPSAAVRTNSTRVIDIVSSDSSVSFDVTRLGTPVVVRIPYFPNWQATGASGPYLITPNLMVVVPRAHHVTLRYGTTGVDWAGRAGSGLGVLAVVGLVVLPRRRRTGTDNDTRENESGASPPSPDASQDDAAVGTSSTR